MNTMLARVRALRRFLPRRPFRRPPILPLSEIEHALARRSATAIPPVLHQIWLGPERPPLEPMASCRHMHPGWQYVLWTEENLPPMTNRHVFDALGCAYEGKADVLRYEILFRYGGVYVDADQLCLRAFDDLLGGTHAFFAGYQQFMNPALDRDDSESRLVANAVLGATPGHPILERIVRRIADTPADPQRPAWQTVGPAALTGVLEEGAGASAVIHPFHVFYPYHYTELIPDTPDQMLKAIHYQSHSVSLWGTTLGRYGRWRRLPGVKPGWNAARCRVPAAFAALHPKLRPTVYGA